MTDQDQESSEANFCNYPLNIARSEVDADNLCFYSQELNLKSDTLFVQESASCKVELWQVPKLTGHQGKYLAHIVVIQKAKLKFSRQKGRIGYNHQYCGLIA